MSEIGTVSFIDPDGLETTLTRSDAFDVIGEIEGHGLPPMIFREEAIPEQPGVRLRSVIHGPREVAVPVLTNATAEMTLGQRIRNFGARLDAVKGQGRLRWVRDSETRELECRYRGGFELRQRSSHFHVGVLIFRAADNPYWQDATDSSLGFGTLEPETFFGDMPLKLARDSISGGALVDNTGEVETWPVWTLIGPGTSFTLTNDTTGQTMKIVAALLAGESFVIDTRPGRKTVTKNDGTNLYPFLTTDSSLWTLAPGLNTVTATLEGATVDSIIDLTYRRRYLTV